MTAIKGTGDIVSSGLHCATWNSCWLLGCQILILEFVARANKIQAKYVYSVRSSSQVFISQSRLVQVEDQKVQCLVPNFQYRRPPKMQISMTMMSMRTILLVNTLRYIFLSILLLLPSSTSVSTSLKIQDIIIIALLKVKPWTCFLSFLGSPSESQDLLWCLLPQHQFLRQPEKGFLYVISVADCFLLKQYLLCPSQAVASSLKHPCPSKHLLPSFVKKCVYVSHFWNSSPILIRRPWRSCSCPLSRPLRSSVHPPLSFLQVPSQLRQPALLLPHTAQHLSPVLKINLTPNQNVDNVHKYLQRGNSSFPFHLIKGFAALIQ